MSTIPLSYLFPSPLNPRKTFDQDALNELADSIREHGNKQPLLVRPKESDDNETFEIIMGERRFRAATIAGLEEVPVTIEVMDDATAKALMLVENMQRADLSAMEEAAGFKELQSLSGKNVIEIARSIGKSKEYVYARMKLLYAADVTKDALAAGVISAGHAVILARRSESEQRILVDNIQTEELSVADLAKHVAHSFTDLRLAPFDILDGKLLKGTPACHSCDSCSWFNPDLLAETKSDEMPEGDPNVCANRFCFNDKRKAHIHALAKKAQKIQKLKEPLLLVSFKDHDELATELHWTEVTPEKSCKNGKPALVVGAENWQQTETERIGTVILACVDEKCPVHGLKEYRPLPDAKAIKAKEKEARAAIAAKENQFDQDVHLLLAKVPKGGEWRFALQVVPFGVGLPVLDEMTGPSDYKEPTIQKWIEKQTPASAALFFAEHWIRSSQSAMTRAGAAITHVLHTDAKPPAKVKDKPKARDPRRAPKAPKPAKAAKAGKPKGGKK